MYPGFQDGLQGPSSWGFPQVQAHGLALGQQLSSFPALSLPFCFFPPLSKVLVTGFTVHGLVSHSELMDLCAVS